MIGLSDIPQADWCLLAGLIDAALPDCRWKRIFSMTVNLKGLDAAYATWRVAPIVNTSYIPQIEELIQRIKDDYAKRQAS